MIDNRTLPVETPEPAERVFFDDPAAAVARLIELYERSAQYLLDHFVATLAGNLPKARYRAFYPELRINIPMHTKPDSRLSFGHVSVPGTYASSITRPDLFRGYLTQQIGLVMKNHGVSVSVGDSDTSSPLFQTSWVSSSSSTSENTMRVERSAGSTKPDRRNITSSRATTSSRLNGLVT